MSRTTSTIAGIGAVLSVNTARIYTYYPKLPDRDLECSNQSVCGPQGSEMCNIS